MKNKKGMKWRLAVTGIKKNSKLYLPYILAGIGMVAVFYIMMELGYCSLLTKMKSGTVLGVILRLGVIVIGVFSISMLFYTNSFLIKTRTKEFGLYNILGMDRKNIAGILVAETAITGAVSIIGGLALGMLLSKLAESVLARLVGEDAEYQLSIDIQSVIYTILIFTAFFFAVMLKNVIKISRQKTIELLKNDRLGEKPPKARYFLAIIGLGLLAFAYYIAVSIQDPVGAITYFFVAVLLVIVATQLLFIVGSVTVCRLLQKKKGYYYRTKHFVSLSSMSFRMKRNGAGLAQICILSTMVLVMIASTSCLYFGKESSMENAYPRELLNYIGFESESTREDRLRVEEEIKDRLDAVARANDIVYTRPVEMEYKTHTIYFQDGEMKVLKPEDGYVDEYSETSWDVFFISLEDYNRYMGTQETLADDEAICCEYGDVYPAESITYLGRNRKYTIKQRTKDFYNLGSINVDLIPRVVFAVKELPKLDGEQNYNESDTIIKWEYDVDYVFTDGSELSDDQKLEISDVFYAAADDYLQEKGEESVCYYWYCEEKEWNRQDFYCMYGGLFFLGIVLSFVFICALGLMIYYKQISEGYEDRSRFEIMQKVGMTEKDIRSSINSQMGSVFYMPLVAAVVHLGFAFPMIYRCLILFGVVNFKPLLITSLISVAAFALIYAVIYKITSNSYYRLVK